MPLNKVIEPGKVSRFARWLTRAERIVIAAHTQPDGDAVGSTLALCHFLGTLGKDAHVILPTPFPDFLKWLPGSRDIIIYERNKGFADRLLAGADVICCLDFNTPSRTGAMCEALRAAKARKILIDHHLDPESFCDVSISLTEMSSTSELVFRLICQMGYFGDMTRETAECICTGMMTDTGGFTFNSNRPELYFIIAQLLTKGIDKDAIYRRVFNNNNESRFRLMGHVLTTMRLYPRYHTALISLTKEEQQGFSYIRGDSEGFVNIPLGIKDIFISCFLREDTERQIIKVSLRSVGTFPCNQIASEAFGGGGHLNAAGGEVRGTMDEAKARFEQVLAEYAQLIDEHAKNGQ